MRNVRSTVSTILMPSTVLIAARIRSQASRPLASNVMSRTHDVGLDLDDVDGLDQPAGLADGHRYVSEHPQAVRDLDADGEGVLGRGRGHGVDESMDA